MNRNFPVRIDISRDGVEHHSCSDSMTAKRKRQRTKQTNVTDNWCLNLEQTFQSSTQRFNDGLVRQRLLLWTSTVLPKQSAEMKTSSWLDNPDQDIALPMKGRKFGTVLGTSDLNVLHTCSAQNERSYPIC
jgi:hypothetical protein